MCSRYHRIQIRKKKYLIIWLIYERSGCSAADVHTAAVERSLNFRPIDDSTIGLSLDETTSRESLLRLLEAFGAKDAEV